MENVWAQRIFKADQEPPQIAELRQKAINLGLRSILAAQEIQAVQQARNILESSVYDAFQSLPVELDLKGMPGMQAANDLLCQAAQTAREKSGACA